MVDFNKMAGMDSWDFSGDDNSNENLDGPVEPEFVIPISQESVDAEGVADDSAEEVVAQILEAPVPAKPEHVRESYSIKEFQSRGVYRDMVTMDIMCDSVDTVIDVTKEIAKNRDLFTLMIKEFIKVKDVLPEMLNKTANDHCAHLRNTLQEELDSTREGSIAKRIEEYTGNVVVHGAARLNEVTNRNEDKLNGLVGSLGDDIIVLKGVVVNVAKESKYAEEVNDELRTLVGELMTQNKELSGNFKVLSKQHETLVEKFNDLIVVLQPKPKKKWW